MGVNARFLFGVQPLGDQSQSGDELRAGSEICPASRQLEAVTCKPIGLLGRLFQLRGTHLVRFDQSQR